MSTRDRAHRIICDTITATLRGGNIQTIRSHGVAEVLKLVHGERMEAYASAGISASRLTAQALAAVKPNQKN